MAGRIASSTGQETGSSSASERTIRKYHSMLRRELNIPVLLPYLSKYHLITTDSQEELTLKTTTSITEVDKLVAELPRTGDNFLECFIKCLRESVAEEPGTSHKEIADALEEDLKHQSTPGFAVSSCGPTATETAMAENGHSYQLLEIGNSFISERVLQKCHLKLRKELNVLILLPYLNKYHLITADVHEKLLLQTTNATKVDRLVAELQQRGDNFLDSFIKCLRESVEEEPGTCHGQIADDLEEEMNRQTAPEFTDSCVDHTGNILIAMTEETSQREPLLVHHEHHHQPSKTSTFDEGLCLKICCNRWCCCYTTVLLIIVLLTLLLIILSQVPHVVPSVHPKYVYWNNTIELQFEQMPWLDRIDMAFNNLQCGPQGKLYVLQGRDCSELTNITTNYVDPQSPVGRVYMRPGSTINFTVSPNSNGQVWLFSDHESTDDFDGNPAQFNCNNPPLGAYCFEAAKYLNGSYLYPITQPAFYDIRQQPSSLNVTPNYNRVLFDSGAISSSAASTQLSSVSTTVYFGKPFLYEKTCVLLSISDSSFCYSRIDLQVSNATRRQDVLLYPAIAVVIFVAVLIVLIIVHVYHLSRKQVRRSFNWL